MFKSRISAAESLLEQLSAYKDMKDAVIVAIPRGALPIGELLATELHLPLDVVLSKKIGAPNNKELAIGAVSLDSISIHAAYAPLVSDKYIATKSPAFKNYFKNNTASITIWITTPVKLLLRTRLSSLSMMAYLRVVPLSKPSSMSANKNLKKLLLQSQSSQPTLSHTLSALPIKSLV